MRASYLDQTSDLDDDELVSVVDDLPLWSAPFGQKLLDVVKIAKNLTVLDVGCGAGFPIVELAARLGESCRCYGIDPWAEALTRARQKAAAWHIHTLQFEQAVAESLPFDDQFFDVIISNNGLNNVQDERAAMGEIARVAKPGAQLVFTLNLPETFEEFYSAFANVLLKAGKRRQITSLYAHIYKKRKPLDYWRELLASAGFQIQQVYNDSFTFRYCDAKTMLDHFLIKTAFLPSWRAILDDDGAAEIFSAVEQELDKKSEKDGKIILTVPWCCIQALKTSEK
jgi:arsenite methyltransferase